MRKLCAFFGASLFVFNVGAFAQAPNGLPGFEVASVRVSQTGRAGGEGSRREQIQVSPAGVTLRNTSFRSCVRWAYHVMDYQVTGPDWVGQERYDIVAKAASAVPEEQLRLMLQALLAERFKLELHRQTKDMAAYILTVAKGGPKFKESHEDGESVIQPNQGRMEVVVQRTPLAQLCDMLSNMLRAPVLDQTELKGKYDITINVGKYVEEARASAGDGKGFFDPIPLLMNGIQQELGLKLDAKKTAVDLLIVDHAEKTPVEN